MLNEAQGASCVRLFGPLSPSSVGAASSTWFPVASFEGDIMIIQQVASLPAGSVGGIIEHASDSAGTGAASFNMTTPGASFTTVAASNDVQIGCFRSKATGGFIRWRGIGITAATAISVTMVATPRNM